MSLAQVQYLPLSVSALQAMYGEDAFKSPVLPHCFRTHIKQYDPQLVQIQEIAGLLTDAIAFMMVVLTPVRQRLQHTATNLGQELALELIMDIEDLDGAASTQLGHALCHEVSFFNSPKKRRKEAINRSGDATNELVGMLSKGYPPCLGALFKGNIESALSGYFDYKQHSNQLNWD